LRRSESRGAEPATAQRRATDPGQRPTRPVRTPLRQWLADLRGGPLAAFAFLGAAFGLWWLVAQQGPAPSYTAIVRGERVVLRAPEGQVVEQVLVEPYAEVTEGTVLCTFDGAELDAELAVARAEALALEAEVGAEAARLAAETRRIEFEAASLADRVVRERATERRRLALDLEELRLEALAQTVEIAALEVDRRRYEVRLEFLDQPAQAGLAPRSEAAEVAARLDGIGLELEQRRAVLAEAEAAAERAADRLAELDARDADPGALAGADPEALLEPLRRRIDVQTALAASLALRADRFVLRAPVDGRVEQVTAHAGRRTVADEDLVTLLAHIEQGQVRADLFVPEGVICDLVPGDRVELVAPDLAGPDGRAVALEGRILREAPSFVQLPQRLWLDPRVPQHGRSFLVALPDGVDLRAGARLLARRLE